MTSERYIQRAYLNASNAGAFSGLQKFVKERKLTGIKRVEAVLSKLEAFSRHRKIKTNVLRRPVFSHRPFENLQTDLVDMTAYSASNKHYGWILFAVDLFTKYGFAVPIKRKSQDEVLRGIKIILKQIKQPVLQISHDQGKEYVNRAVSSYLKRRKIRQFFTFSTLKAQTVEKFLSNIKAKLWRYFTHTKRHRWIDILPDMITSYNNTTHRSHGFKPSQIKKGDIDLILYRLYRRFVTMPERRPKYTVGQAVRISTKRLAFSKSYRASFSSQLFYISTIESNFPVVYYRLRDDKGRVIQGTYIESDIKPA